MRECRCRTVDRSPRVVCSPRYSLDYHRHHFRVHGVVPLATHSELSCGIYKSHEGGSVTLRLICEMLLGRQC